MNLSQLTFFTQAGGEQTITVQHYSNQTAIESFADAKRSIGGKLHPRLRGSRQQFEITYEASIEKDVYRQLFNNIVTDLESGIQTVTVSEGGDLSNARVVVPTDDFKYQAQHEAQIGWFTPSMSFTAQGINTAVGGWVELDWVLPGWVEMGV